MVQTAAEAEAPPTSAWLSKGEKSIRAIIYEKIEPPPTGAKDVLLKFAGERYSGHGLKRMTSDDGRYTKAVWVLIFVCCFCLMCFGIFHSFCHFMHFPKTTTTEVTYNEEVTFPAVTVCNQNAIDSKKVEEFFGKTYSDLGDSYDVDATKELDMIWRLYRLDRSLAEEYASIREDTTNTDTCENVLDRAKCMVDSELCTDTSSASSTTASASLMAAVDGSEDAEQLRAKLSFTTNQLQDFAFSYEDLVTECMFNGQACSASQKHVWKHSKYGTCITFNGDLYEDSAAVKTTKYGKMHGLKLKLDANLQRYINTVSPAQGFRVVVHDPMTVAFPEESGYDIPAGKKTQMPVNTKYADRLGKPYGMCGGGKPDENRGFTGGWLWGSRRDPYHMDTIYTSHFDHSHQGDDNIESHHTEREWIHEGQYSESGCRRFYRNSIFEDKCSCTKVLDRTQIESNLPDCDVTNADMASCIIGISPLQESRVNCMNCHAPCQETAYKPVIITGQLDQTSMPHMSSASAKTVLDGDHCDGVDVKEAELEAIGYKINYQEEMHDMTELEVFIQSPRIEKTSEYPKYQVQELLFNVAGIMLLLLGSSVFLIPEILELILDLLCSLCRRKKEQSKEDDQYTSEEVMIEYPEINELSTNLDDICGGIFAIPEVGRKGPAPAIPEKRPKSTMSIAYDIPAVDEPDNRPMSTKSIAYDIPAGDTPENRPKSTMSISYEIPADECVKRPKSTMSIAYDIPAGDPVE